MCLAVISVAFEALMSHHIDDRYVQCISLVKNQPKTS